MKYLISFTLLFTVLTQNATAQSITNCSNCANEILTFKQIKELSVDEIRFLINDLYARRGYKFSNYNIENYYSAKTWYKPVTDNTKIVYNDTEEKNIKFLQSRNVVLKTERAKLLDELKKLKSTILVKDHALLVSKYSYAAKNEQFDDLFETVRQLDFEAINWVKNKGLYRVQIDNGDYVVRYELQIESNQIKIIYGLQGGTELEGEMYPNENVDEHAYIWNFEWKGNKIIYIRLDVAG